eukprot:GAHX01008650.1.p1 GENE.GAHX01008650.1~~GAHX01008650.1.p1  ORF type:complete len:57 (+),score=3.30 GAHX01008650.1:57-227(+)
MRQLMYCSNGETTFLCKVAFVIHVFLSTVKGLSKCNLIHLLFYYRNNYVLHRVTMR